MKAKKEETSKETKTVTMFTYADLIRKYSIIRAVQLVCGQKELSSELKSKVMDIRFALKKHKKDLDEMIKDGSTDLKPSGFDDRMRESQEFEEQILRKYPNEQVLKEEMLSNNLTPQEEELKEKHDAFMPEYQKWMKECDGFTSAKLQDKVAFEAKKFTRKEYDEILNVNSSESYSIDPGIARMIPGTMKLSDFMELLYEEFVV